MGWIKRAPLTASWLPRLMKTVEGEAACHANRSNLSRILVTCDEDGDGDEDEDEDGEHMHCSEAGPLSTMSPFTR